MKAIIIQPPLVQLNTPYPSGAYLSSFFKSQNIECKWFDLSFELFSEIFCKNGLKKLFDQSEKKALLLAQKAFESGDENTAFNLRRYVSESSLWINSIDQIVAVLNGSGNREFCHKFVFSPFSPRGARMENFLAALNRLPTTDDARFLASMALSDLADYIAAVYDDEFSLVRYAESLAVSEESFSSIEKKLDSPVLENFYKTVLEKKLTEFADFLNLTFDSDFKSDEKNSSCNEKNLVCISVPFAGTFASALYTGKFLKEKFGSKIFVCIGGGFVNTELREMKDSAISKYIDAISFDRGYGSYRNFLDSFCSATSCGEEESVEKSAEKEFALYKMRIFTGEKVFDCKWESEPYKNFEDKITSTLVPDYSEIDFSKYPRMIDDVNPMQRLWSDGSWIKAYLAHGCYWHKCAFCDVNLDYVCGYELCDVKNLFYGLKNQCEEKKVFGIHFVDEAMPPLAMKNFAKLNSLEQNKLSWWGNVRFEKIYSRDLADFLSYGGLIGVSGGIEIATGTGLDAVHKGTDLDSIVSACCAFKEAGILIHAYMIYGYWGEDELDTINSMETLRQFFKAGLLDSCFWHKFVLTRHSRIYSEWKEGLYPKLKVFEPKNSGVFAKNGLHFEGEKESQKFGNGLNASLNSWMKGEGLDKKVGKWFDFKTPLPSIPSDYVEKAILRYEKKRDLQFALDLDAKKLWWLGGKIIVYNKNLIWNYMGEEFSVPAKNLSGKNLTDFLKKLAVLEPNEKKEELCEKIEFSSEEKMILKLMRGNGLVQV